MSVNYKDNGSTRNVETKIPKAFATFDTDDFTLDPEDKTLGLSERVTTKLQMFDSIVQSIDELKNFINSMDFAQSAILSTTSEEITELLSNGQAKMGSVSILNITRWNETIVEYTLKESNPKKVFFGRYNPSTGVISNFERLVVSEELQSVNSLFKTQVVERKGITQGATSWGYWGITPAPSIPTGYKLISANVTKVVNTSSTLATQNVSMALNISDNGAYLMVYNRTNTSISFDVEITYLYMKI